MILSRFVKKNLKNTGIVIAHDLSPVDQAKNRILIQHLKYASNTNHKAYIKSNKLFIDDEPYEAEQLEDSEIINIDKQEDILELAQKANSAPPTPTIRENNSFEDSDPNKNSSKNIDNFDRPEYNTNKINNAQIPHQATGAIKKKFSSNLKFPTKNTTPKSDPMKNRTWETRAQRNSPK
ncbi:hypothetical protein JTB14_032209 [Gonioctena quinquepunctata]|nr:hypothetical protein JTB14_032209 [Gonioctena quinquepunctata]